MYKSNLSKIFKKFPLYKRTFLKKPKYDNSDLVSLLKEYLKEDITQKLTIVDKNRSPLNLDNFMDINVEFINNEDKKYAIRKRHKNKLLEA